MFSLSFEKEEDGMSIKLFVNLRKRNDTVQKEKVWKHFFAVTKQLSAIENTQKKIKIKPKNNFLIYFNWRLLLSRFFSSNSSSWSFGRMVFCFSLCSRQTKKTHHDLLWYTYMAQLNIELGCERETKRMKVVCKTKQRWTSEWHFDFEHLVDYGPFIMVDTTQLNINFSSMNA